MKIEPFITGLWLGKGCYVCYFTFPETASLPVEDQRSQVTEEFLDQEKPGSRRIRKDGGFGAEDSGRRVGAGIRSRKVGLVQPLRLLLR